MAQSTPWRPQPPSISDPEAGEAPQWNAGIEEESSGMETEASESAAAEREQPNWLKLAKDAFRDSTTYLDQNYRKNWDDSLRMFNGQHASDSKYNSELFAKRAHSFIPKTRSIIRKNEAAAAAAHFSNLDTVSIKAQNQGDKRQRISAEVMQHLIQYRLTHTIPWFQFVMGSVQDAQAQGACIAHIYWSFRSRKVGDELEIYEDKPCIELRPIENIRFDPAACWYDPLHTSPYIIDMIPMYVGEVKERMENPDPKGRVWKEYTNTTFRMYMDNPDDSTRQSRLGAGQDPTKVRRTVSEYDIVWVHRHIHRFDGQDFEFYTLGSEKLLTDPEPLKKTVFHGRRPYEMGTTVLETHKPLPTPIPILTKSLQDDLNETRNQRSDNVKFVLNKGWLVRRGKNVDTAALTRNTPGRIVLLDSLAKDNPDVEEQSWPDVTQSAYLEEDRISANFDELVGNFNPMQVQQQRTPRESERTMLALQSPSNLLTEYLLKTHATTFIEPVLRQLVLLEQFYETDERVLTIAGEKAQVRQKFGVDQVTDTILEEELTVNVNVGMGATDPAQKLARFSQAVLMYAKISVKPPPGLNLTEVLKELCALSGYQDGERFAIQGDPEKVALTQQIQQLMKIVEMLKMKVGDKSDANKVKLQTSRETNFTNLLMQDKEHAHEKIMELAGYIQTMEQGEQGHAHEMEKGGQAPPMDPNKMQALQFKAEENAQNAQAQRQQEEEQKRQQAEKTQQDHVKPLMEAIKQSTQAQSEFRDELKKLNQARRKKKGRAKLPSGQMMEFEMEES
jgi:hypothetical protein